MVEAAEAQLWRVLGSSFVVGGAVPLAFDIQNVTRTGVVDPEALKLGVWCSFTILAGLTALVAGRLLRVLRQPEPGRSAWAWTALAYICMPAGAIAFQWGWQRTMSVPATLNNKAFLLGAAFVFTAGLVAMVGNRMASHLRELACSRANHSLEQAEMIAATARMN